MAEHFNIPEHDGQSYDSVEEAETHENGHRRKERSHGIRFGCCQQTHS